MRRMVVPYISVLKPIVAQVLADTLIVRQPRGAESPQTATVLPIGNP